MRMRTSVVVVFAAMALAACEKDRMDRPGETMTTGAKPVTAEEIRLALLEARPGARESISALNITNTDGVVTLRGPVEDDSVRRDLVDRVRRMPNVKEVKDELTVAPKPAAMEPTQPGQPAQPAQPMQPMQPKEPGMQPSMPSTMSAHATAVRAQLTKDMPQNAPLINKLTIIDDGTMVSLSGVVPDEATRQALLKSAKKTSGVKNVRDEMTVEKK